MKKGQATVFIILGAILILVVVVVLLVIGKSSEMKKEQVIDPSVQPIYDFYVSCMESVGADAIDYVSLTGGYYDSDYYSVQEGIAIYFINF